ncbi:hypothetical protein UK23_18660 [Lentzea aerocolonigenes]|uniref:Uncharacterized protein n=1 Tax=Lentzea aerocolonigenes TaxID=68170 RepID=A0A0F0GZF4_LENAE|nr:hypothetical protein [Lentzea aerocolonigenes]KJK47941.1 hypothetical protein UK23_18660 [Lentzea aerocolonigenes]
MKKTVPFGVLVGALLCSTATPADAAAAQKYCVAVTSADKQSTTMTCDTRENSAKLHNASVAAADATLLMTWYDNWHYNTDNGWIQWFGYAGTCDSSGYVVDLDASNFTAWRNRISSFTIHGACGYTVAYKQDHNPNSPSNGYTGNAYYVDDEFNDHINRFRIRTFN